MTKLKKRLKKIFIRLKIKNLNNELEALEHEKEFSNIPYEEYLAEKNEFLERLGALLEEKKSITDIRNKLLIEKNH